MGFVRNHELGERALATDVHLVTLCVTMRGVDVLDTLCSQIWELAATPAVPSKPISITRSRMCMRE
jgi:hypothetical protein